MILTNGGSRSQRDKLARLRADKLVDALLISEEIGQVKPAAAAFHAALNAVTGRASAAVTSRARWRPASAWLSGSPRTAAPYQATASPRFAGWTR